MSNALAQRTLRTLQTGRLTSSIRYSLRPRPPPARFAGTCAPAVTRTVQVLHTGGRRSFVTLGMAATNCVPAIGYEDGTPQCVAAFVTAPEGNDVAVTIAKTLVEEKLAACVKIISQNQSVYMWDGKLNIDNEKVLMIKTRAELAESLVKRVKEIHPYDTPEVIILPIAAGSDAYLKWVAGSTKSL